MSFLTSSLCLHVPSKTPLPSPVSSSKLVSPPPLFSAAGGARSPARQRQQSQTCGGTSSVCQHRQLMAVKGAETHLQTDTDISANSARESVEAHKAV